MELSKYRLGELIEQCDERNTKNDYLADDVRGISTEKSFMRISKNCEETHLLLQSESTSCRQMKGIHLIFQPIQCVAYRYPRT